MNSQFYRRDLPKKYVKNINFNLKFNLFLYFFFSIIDFDFKFINYFLLLILGGPWRIGKPSDLENWKDTSIFMRLSRQNDAKPILQDNDLSKKNFELRK